MEDSLQKIMKKSEIAANVELALKNDQKAITALYNYTYPSMYSLIYRLCHNKEKTEEILQESYITAFSNLKKIHYKEQFWKWLRGIVLNKWRNYIKENIRRADYVTLEELDDISDFGYTSSVSSQERIEIDEARAALWDAVNSLPENQRVCIVLFYCEKMSVEEISDVLNIPIGSVKSRMHYGRKKLKDKLNKSDFSALSLPSASIGNISGDTAVLAKVLTALEVQSGGSAAVAAGGGFLLKIVFGFLSTLVAAGTVGMLLNMPTPSRPVSDTDNSVAATSVKVSATNSSSDTTLSSITDSVTSTTTSAVTSATAVKTVTFDYQEVNGGIKINKYTGTAENVVIPSQINGMNVIIIAPNAFKESRLHSVDIPGSVASIGDNAFCDCTALSHVTLRGGIKSIGDAAFLGCASLTSIKIPSSVNKVGIYAFAYCSSLKEASISNGVAYINYCAFYKCGNLRRVTLPASVNNIGNNAFAETSGDLIMWVSESSYAHEYAEQNGFNFELIL